MGRIRLTAKRQATLPLALCNEMLVGPGDTLRVERVTLEGEVVWLLRPDRPAPGSWFGALRSYAVGLPHDMETIRRSIAL